MLDGTRTAEQISTELVGRFPQERVLFGLDRLVRSGRARVGEGAADGAGAAFWNLAGLDGDQAAGAVAAGAVDLRVLGDVDPRPVAAALAACGIDVGTGTDPGTGTGTDSGINRLMVAVTDDYLHPALAEHNAAALRSGRPWLLARPVGSVLWVGPLLEPGRTGCWECLAQRLSANRQALTYLQRRVGRDAPFATAAARLPVTTSLGAQIIALEAAKWLAGMPDAEPVVITLDTFSLATERHQLVRRPQCPACGDPSLMAARAHQPVTLSGRKKRFTAEGGHRATPPEEFVDAFLHQVSPVTGAVTGLFHLDVGHGVPPGLLHGYAAGHNLAREVRDLRMLRHGLRSQSCGKGMTDIQAKASALGEGIERYSGVFQGDEARVTATLAGLDGAIDPASCLLFSGDQYAGRTEWNVGRSPFNVVYDPLDPDTPIEWSPVWSLNGGGQRWLPTSYLYYGYPQRGGGVYAVADSNGNAAGTSREDAVLQGFFELVERDAVALWWYNRVQRPAIDLDAFAEPWIDRIRELYAGLAREVWALDLTSDFGIPVVGAVSRRTDKQAEDILVAFGAHLDPRIALLRALTEMNQFLPAVLPIGSDGSGTYGAYDPEQEWWWRNATVAEATYLRPDPRTTPSGPGRWPALAHDDLADDLALVERLVTERGMEMLVLDQTRPDIGLPVAKVIVPGMRHFWARFAPGRLYEVPVGLGWLAAPTPEHDLNPVPMFI